MKETDQTLIKKALAGDQNAYRSLLERHKRTIFHIIYRIVHNRAEADDLVQETFMKAFTSLSSYRSEFKFTTWLYKIAANCSIDYLRKKKLEAFSLNQKLEVGESEIEIEVPDWSSNPEIELASKQKSIIIEEAIESLPKKYQEVIMYRHKQDKSYEEISQILMVPVGTVKARIFRARELLKKKLKQLR